MSDLGMRGALRMALPAFVTGKAISLGVGWLTVWSTSQVPGTPTRTQLAEAFANWDGIAYRTVAESGYPSGPLDLSVNSPSLVWGRFPGLPIAAHLLSYVFVDVVLSAVVFNAVCELVGLAYLIRLARIEGRDEQTATTAAWLLALFPYAIFMTVFYTEAPFIAASTAALYYMRRGGDGDYAVACVAGALATTMRITGLLLIPTLLVDRYLRRRRILDPTVLLAAIIAVPLLLFMLYARARTDDLLAYFHVLESPSYNQQFTWPWDSLRTTLDAAAGQPAYQYGYFFEIGVVTGLLGIGVVALMWVATVWKRPRLAVSLVVYSTLLLVSSLSVPFWGGVARYLMVMTPAYILGADFLRRNEGLRVAVLAASASLLAFGTDIITSGRFLA